MRGKLHAATTNSLPLFYFKRQDNEREYLFAQRNVCVLTDVKRLDCASVSAAGKRNRTWPYMQSSRLLVMGCAEYLISFFKPIPIYHKNAEHRAILLCPQRKLDFKRRASGTTTSFSRIAGH